MPTRLRHPELNRAQPQRLQSSSFRKLVDHALLLVPPAPKRSQPNLMLVVKQVLLADYIKPANVQCVKVVISNNCIQAHTPSESETTQLQKLVMNK
jgi:hypothetical protein